jgi:hypothetical protein
LAAIASSAALLLSRGQTKDDLEIIGNLMSTIGSMILTFSTSGCLPECDANDCERGAAKEISDSINQSINQTITQQQQNI